MALREYQYIELIGDGQYGKVYIVKNKTGKEFAMKEMPLDCTPVYIREITSMACVGEHKNCIALRWFKMTKRGCFILMDLANADLMYYYLTNTVCPPQFCKFYMKQMLEGIAWAHSHQILHCDVSLANVLVFPKKHICIGDWGLSKHVAKDHCITDNFEVYALAYRAPEVLMRHPYGYPADVWALGACFFALVLNRFFVPVEGSAEDCLKAIQTFQWDSPDFLEFEARVGPQGKALLRSMLEVNPRRRITAADALEHEYFL